MIRPLNIKPKEEIKNYKAEEINEEDIKKYSKLIDKKREKHEEVNKCFKA